MPIRPRSPVLDVLPAVHGGPDSAELRRLGLNPMDLLDFSSNINPYGPSPHVREAVARTPLDRYPDNESSALRSALAEDLGIAPHCILVGNGVSELIWLTSLAFLRPLDRVLVLGPTFAEYARMAALADARLNIQLASEESGFAPSTVEIRSALDSRRPRLVFLCNPNNPTGAVVGLQEVAEWSHAHADTLFIVDESYIPFAPSLGSVCEMKRDNVVVLRSMTKDHALAGLRLGYAIGAANVIAALSHVRPPWSVSALAQAAGIAALRDREHLTRSLELLAVAKDELMAALADLGMKVLPSAAPFFLVRVDKGTAVRRALLDKGILVRDCASFGLPQYIRICTRRPEENARLVSTLREVTHAG